MERTNKRMRLCIALLIINILFIWGNSLLPGSVSGAFSGWVKDILSHIFSGLSGDAHTGHGLLRKLAHFTEFACLGALLTWLLGMLAKPGVLALAGGFLVACLDETIQRFVPDRGPSFKDVMIDTSGAAVGMILLFVGYAYVKRRKKQATEDTSV
ncbi:MAG: VanZ family protein [Oscillospiraceae bacterium]|nr:VanZ family protein [Oscillospiraceae bacterium]